MIKIRNYKNFVASFLLVFSVLFYTSVYAEDTSLHSEDEESSAPLSREALDKQNAALSHGPFLFATETIGGAQVDTFRLNLSPFNEIPLKSDINFETGDFAFTSFPTDKEIKFGPIALKKPKLAISKTDGVALSAEARFFGKESSASLKLYQDDNGPIAELTLAFKNPLSIPLTPNKDLISIDSVSAVKKTESFDIIGKGKLLGSTEPNTQITFSPKTGGASLRVDKLTLADFIEPLKDSPFGKIGLKNTDLTIDNLRLIRKKKHMITFKGQVSINDGFPSLESMSDIGFDLTYLAQGPFYSFQTNVNNIPLEEYGTIQELNFSIKSADFDTALEARQATPEEIPSENGDSAEEDTSNPEPASDGSTEKKRPTINITGKADLNLPFDIGALHTEVIADLNDNQQIFTALLGKNIDFNGVGINSLKFIATKYLKADESDSGRFKPHTDFRFEGSAQFHGADVTAVINCSKDDKGKRVYNFLTRLNNEMFPFRDIPGIDEIPGIKDISLKNVTAGFDSNKTVFFSGESTIAGITSIAKVRKTTDGMMLSLVLPEEISLGDIIPPAKGTFADDFKFSKTALYLSSFTGKDPDIDLRIAKGFTFVAEMDMSHGFFNDARKILKIIPNSLVITANSDPETESFIIGAHIPVKQQLGPMEMSNFILELGLKQARPIFAFLIDVTVRPPAQDEPLNLVGRIELEAIGSLMVAATMQGMWNDPFGIHGFKLGNIAIEAGMMVAPPWVKDFGFAGSVQIGRVAAAVAMKVDLAKPERCGFMASLNALALADIVSLGNDALKAVSDGKASIPMEAIPPLEINDFEYKLFPETTTIGELVFQKGITLKGMINLFGFHAGMLFNLDSTGIIAKGWMDKINLGGVIEVKRGDIVYPGAPPGEGPYIDVALTPSAQHFIISGMINLLMIKQQTDIFISPQRVYFDVSMDMWTMFKAKFHAETVNDNNCKDFIFSLELEQHLLDFLKEKGVAAFKALAQEAEQKIGEAQKKVDDLNESIQVVEDKENELKRQIEDLKKIMQQKVEAAQAKVREAQKKVDDAQRDVDTAANTIGSKQNEVNSLQNQINEINRQIEDKKRELNSSIIDLVPFNLFDDEKGAILYAAERYRLADGIPLEFMNYVNQLATLDNNDIHTLAPPYQLYAKDSPPPPPSIQEIGNAIKGGFETAGNAINNAVVQPAIQGAKDLGNTINDKVIQPAGDALKKAAEETKRFAEEQAAKAKQALEQAAAEAKRVADETAAKIKRAAEIAGEFAKKQALKVKTAAEITGLGIKLAGLVAAKETANGILTAAQATVSGVGRAGLETARGALTAGNELVKMAGAEEALKISGLEIAIGGCEASKGTLIANREAARGILEGVKQATKGACLVGEKILEGLAAGFNIRKIGITGKVSDYVKGVSPIYEIDATIFGKDKHVSLQASLTDPNSWVKVVEGLVSLLL